MARALIRELDESIWERYPEVRPADGEGYRRGNRLAPDTAFFVAWVEAIVALDTGHAVVRLVTGTAQTEAIALYERAGYRRIPCGPPYDVLPISICMEKPLR